MEADEQTPGDARRARGPRYLRTTMDSARAYAPCVELPAAARFTESPVTYAVPATGPTQPGTQRRKYPR